MRAARLALPRVDKPVMIASSVGANRVTGWLNSTGFVMFKMAAITLKPATRPQWKNDTRCGGLSCCVCEDTFATQHKHGNQLAALGNPEGPEHLGYHAPCRSHPCSSYLCPAETYYQVSFFGSGASTAQTSRSGTLCQQEHCRMLPLQGFDLKQAQIRVPAANTARLRLSSSYKISARGSKALAVGHQAEDDSQKKQGRDGHLVPSHDVGS